LASVLLGAASCGSSPAGAAADAGDPVVEAGAPYDGPFDVPDGQAVTVPLSGCAGPGYAATFAVGSQKFQLTVDTGSGTLAVASNACTNCGVASVYSPGAAAKDQNETTSDTYLAGSWSGEVYSDSVKLVGLDKSVKMDFAAIDSQSGFFLADAGCAFGSRPFAPQGIVGFGPPGLSTQGTDPFLTKLTASGAVADVFAVELCAWGGQLMVGGVDPAKAKLNGPLIYTPLMSTSYYSVKLTEARVSGDSTLFGASDFGTTVVDTGTSVLALPPNVFDAMTKTIEGTTAFKTAFDGKTGWFGTTQCFTSPSSSSAELDAELPALEFSFPGAAGGTVSLTLKATESYLPPSTDGGKTYYCSGMWPSPDPGKTILGAAAMLGHLVIFDVADGKLGFASQAYCPP
jgi:hypothetical protein